MRFEELNSGVIFTNSNCIGCNKCISGCPVDGANIVVRDRDTDRCTVQVDPTKCILCGTCIDSCVHKARTYRDDTDAFFDDLAKGERISLLVAPTLLTDYEKQYNNILGYLKNCGANHIYNTGYGADIMVWVYMNFILNFGLNGVISQFCPVIVNYLEKFRPELLKYLVPVQSPMGCTAIYVSDYLNNTDKLAYISPCIAGEYEITDVNTYGKVSYNVTFERLMKRIEQEDISGHYADDEIPYGLGALISTLGGLSENIRQYIGFNEVLIQTSGPVNIFPYFDHYYYKEVNSNGELPFLVDAMSCTDGCNFGTGTSCGYGMRNEMAFSAHRSKEKAFRSGFVYNAHSYHERLERLNERFQQLDMTSFVRQYGNTRRLEQDYISDDRIEEIFLTMYKQTPEQRHTDCGSCGYKTCRDMACAIASNLNYKENCINYAKERIRRETEKTNLLLEEISSMNDELRRSTQLKSNFLANMSHEIRTPMNAIIGMAEMALRGELPQEERGYIQQIKSSSRSLLAIINDILDFSKIESGKMEINETEYAVMSILHDTVNIVLTRIGEKDITLMVDADPDIPFKLLGDDIRIKQILVNLANNAVKFTESGAVEMILRHERRENDLILKISVRDTGIGIKAEDQEKLFTSFQQVDSKRNRNIEGTGLGLAIAREFVRLMGGVINVESVYGQGSTFSFSIPQKILEDIPSVRLKQGSPKRIAALVLNVYLRENFRKAAVSLGVENTFCTDLAQLIACVEAGVSFLFVEFRLWNQELEKFGKRNPHVQLVVMVNPQKEVLNVPGVRKLHRPVYSLNLASVLNGEQDESYRTAQRIQEHRFEAPDANVLIVDDNTINLTVAKGLLSPLRMNVEVATGALEAIGKLEKKKFDIVFMDHMMPDIDGIEATHMIRNKGGEYFEKLPIIALTANAINNVKEMFLQEGMNDFVPKPIEMLDITTTLRRWLPVEKIWNVTAGQAAEEQTEKQAAGGGEIPALEHIDVKVGVAFAGTVELYRSILTDYYEAIGKKADLIEALEEKEDLEGYTIQVHALKSASKLIGAMEIAELAAFLEQCGHEKKAEPIHAQTGELLRQYREMLTILKDFERQKPMDVQKNFITPEELVERLEVLYVALDDFDLDGAQEILEELERVVLLESETALLEKLSEAIGEMEYEDAANVVTEWKAFLLN